MKFTDLGLSDAVLEGIRGVGFTDCTAVQELVLPVSLTGKDVMVQSKTGSGKTAIYVLTILEKYARAMNAGLPLPVSLIIAPTRELAVQIEEDAQALAAAIPSFKVGCFYGGVGYGNQNKEIESGLALYVGTPGRLIDFARSHKIDFRMFTTVVLDEADRMFDMGFYPDIQKMFSMMLPTAERQTMLLSATLSTRVRNLAWDYMNSPEELESQPEEITVKNITQELFHVTKDEKFPLLLRLLAKIGPASCLIFTNTKDKAVEVSKRLSANGYKSAYLMGDMPQSERLKTLENMKEGKLTILVATDVAARGLQIDDLELVVNYDIPEDFESYVHRIGRTARAGKSGKAITLACEEYIYGLEAIENYIQMKIPVLWSDECDLPEVEDKSAGMTFRSSRRPSSHDSRGGRRGDRRSSSSSRSSRPSDRQRGEKKGSGKPSSHKGSPKKEGADYKKLSSMSAEERMEYYKKAYGGENIHKSQKKDSSQKPKNSAGKPQSQKQQGQKKPASERKPQQKPQTSAVKKPMPTAQVSSAPNQMSTSPAVKKSFWDRIRGLFSKNR